EPLFTMGPRRIFTFGLFEFSLAVFAVLGGLLQTASSFVDFEIWDPDIWQVFFEDQADTVAALGPDAQVVSAIAGLIGVFLIGSATGIVRTFTREWGFLLERTPRGFRRRRGLFTRTDVVMPIHRVQGLKIGTRAIRYRFGWHGLRFVSLAQDSGAANHVVAPFARMDEIEPIVEASGFHLPDDRTDWHRASRKYMFDRALIEAATILLLGIVAWAIFLAVLPDWSDVVLGAALILSGLSALAQVLGWRYRRHALDASQIMARGGILSPKSQIATRLKLHSVEIAQGPIARLRGYATVHLGQAGGIFAIPGVPVARAREVRRLVLDTIAATDFSQLESQQAA
ncbi:MAG: PH domain-containing protein, partial [Erythrobacter sp.]